MNVGILIICTGKYDVFFEDLYMSCESFFLTNFEKEYFVFTDSIKIKQTEKIHIVKQDFLGWPLDTMLRFKMFNRIENELVKMDYLFFLNANLKFCANVEEEVLPNEKNDFLCGVNHPGYFNLDKLHFPYERRPNSKLYIKPEEGEHYFQGCFNGGKSMFFLEMSKILEEKIDEDLKNNITPIYHDESALNWYYKSKKPLVLNPGYSFPEDLNLPFEKKIIQKNKSKYGGHDFLRQKKY